MRYKGVKVLRCDGSDATVGVYVSLRRNGVKAVYQKYA
jgi:hypothetical protein